MTDTTKQLFDAPWKAVEDKDNPFPFMHHKEIVTNNGQGHTIANNIIGYDACRIARLPELYDALVDEATEKCKECLHENLRMGRIPFTGKYDLVEAGCPFKDEQCHTASHLDLLKKVRDGE